MATEPPTTPATATAPAPASRHPGALPAEYTEQMYKPAVIQPDESSDSAPDDDQLFFDQDDAQSIFQPALSPAVTRLTSVKTPAAEKAAAMDRLPGGGLFDIAEHSQSKPPLAPRHPSVMRSATQSDRTQGRQHRVFSLGQTSSQNHTQQPSRFPFPSPWNAGPKEFIVDDDHSHRSALSQVFGQSTRHRRSASTGADAFKKIREALPSITLPPLLPAPLSAKMAEWAKDSPFHFADGAFESKPSQRVVEPTSPSTSSMPAGAESGKKAPAAQSPLSQQPEMRPSPRSSTTLTVRPRLPRRSTSDESMLFTSLSRVSSLGDDERWGDIREQKNSRLKAITDSWDRPNFKLPQFPKMPSIIGSDSSQSSLGLTSRPETIPETEVLSKDAEPVSDFDRALEQLTGDVVVLGGYRGSVLRSAKTHRQVWVPVKVGLNIRKVNMEVGLEPGDDEKMEETIYPSGMLKNIGPVDISKRLFKRLRECDNAQSGKLRVWDYGYDWRLSPHLLSRKLNEYLEKLPSNQGQRRPEDRGVWVIAHSLGGLITRHAINQRPDLYAGVIFAGTPQRCINILGPIRNGDAVLFNEKVLTAQVNFSLRTSFVFLPEDGFCFINKETGEEYPVDFYDPMEWSKYRFSPCIEPPLQSPRSSTFDSLKELASKLPTTSRSRGDSLSSDPRSPQSPTRNAMADVVRRAEVAHDRTLAPQMGTLNAGSPEAQKQHGDSPPLDNDSGTRSRHMAYLSRTLAETKRFRAETAHQDGHREANAYPPMAVIYGKDVPTVYAAHVSSRDVIATTNAYDNLLFASGDGVVLARESMLPEGYHMVKGGRISTDRGHITMLGDLEAVGRALQAIIRGRKKGLGLGTAGGAPERRKSAPNTGESSSP